MTKKHLTPIHPGEILLEEFIKPMNISQYQLAQGLHVGSIRISEIIHGKRSITANTALRLGSILGLALFASIHTHAASNTIPTVTPGLSMSLTGLVLQPNASNLTYAVYTKPLPLTTPNGEQVMVNPGYSASFDLGFQYRFNDLANKANLDWLHVNTSSSDSHDAPGVGDSIAPPYYFGPLAQALTGSHANSNVKFNVDN